LNEHNSIKHALGTGIAMKVVHISSHDCFGGAARSAYRLHAGLREIGCDSTMLVGVRDGNDPSVQLFQPREDASSRFLRYARRRNIAASFRRYRDKRPPGLEAFNDDRSEYQSEIQEQIPDCDVIHLHWVAGLFDYRVFLAAAARRAPLVWTLHDMNPITGGCHYDRECGRFAGACGRCPQLGSSDSHDLSNAVWQRKQRAFTAIPAGRLHVAAPSRWLAGEASRSSLLRSVPIAVIPYGLDTEAFVPRNMSIARNVLGIPKDAHVLFFAAHWLGEPRKGFALLAEALAGMNDISNLFLLSAGKCSGAPSISISHRNLGIVESEHLLSLAYSAADAFVLPTLQDNLPNTLLESLSCGTPVAAFNVGGVPDVLGDKEDGVTGALAQAGNIVDLRRSIRELLAHPDLRATLRGNCRRRAVRDYTLSGSARHYMKLYAELLSHNRAGSVVEDSECRQNQFAPTSR
jgi:glycosyltransferase involved in cell wall biosynthesis